MKSINHTKGDCMNPRTIANKPVVTSGVVVGAVVFNSKLESPVPPGIPLIERIVKRTTSSKSLFSIITLTCS